MEKTLDDVRRFWNEQPLFVGESEFLPGSKEWFQEHEDVYINDCFARHSPDPIFTNGVSTDARILDVGCGPGFWVRYFLRMGYNNVSACDLTSRAVDLARKSLALFGLKEDIEIKIGNAEALPYDDRSFDHINCQGVIHHTPDTGQTIKEFYRVLREGGTTCFSVYHKNILLRNPRALRLFTLFFSKFIKLKGRGRESLLDSGVADEIVRMYDGKENPIGKSFTLEELRYMLRGLFEIKEVGFFYFPARALPFRIPRTIHRWLHRNFGLMIIIRATRM